MQIFGTRRKVDRKKLLSFCAFLGPNDNGPACLQLRSVVLLDVNFLHRFDSDYLPLCQYMITPENNEHSNFQTARRQ
jgi:hypothetical protein